MKRKLVTGLARKSESELLTFSKHVLASMTGNPNFETPQPALEAIRTADDEFSRAMSVWEHGNTRKTLEKNAKREILENLLEQLANYVRMVADIDLDKLLSSGYDISKEPEAHPILPPPLIREINDGAHSGSIKIQLETGPPAKSFTVAYRIQEEEAWKFDFGNTRRSILLEGLTAAKYYFLKVSATNAAGNSEWSQEQRYLVR